MIIVVLYGSSAPRQPSMELALGRPVALPSINTFIGREVLAMEA